MHLCYGCPALSSSTKIYLVICLKHAYLSRIELAAFFFLHSSTNTSKNAYLCYVHAHPHLTGLYFCTIELPSERCIIFVLLFTLQSALKTRQYLAEFCLQFRFTKGQLEMMNNHNQACNIRTLHPPYRCIRHFRLCTTTKVDGKMRELDFIC